MRFRTAVILIAFVGIIIAAACGGKSNTGNVKPVPSATETATVKGPRPLPDRGFKAQVTVPDPPVKLRPGQKETITVRVKNLSDVIWWQRGGEPNDRADNKFYMAVGNHWLDKDGKRTTEMEGHCGAGKDLRPGEETETTLLITAPKQPGEYILEVDMLQEGVCWFGDKGSTTSKTKVMVVK